MPASISRPVARPQRFGLLWLLPSGGIGNGIDDDMWAPILEVSADLVVPRAAARAEEKLIRVLGRPRRGAVPGLRPERAGG